ncbi:hypothetical protein B5G34_18045 [Flavonifractor sp. An82]|uniref:glycosyltransferase family A protein n=1 Tax=Flavonifractor sp. An82 TaxID=1965660 RepID=UPI000B39CA0B|nr:glycosyltransferase family 2 protein [Flavonifractor sp. An82]OUN18481.1 hypothetical protein B5G34_18045 [Flavonifractor sp. An82]
MKKLTNLITIVIPIYKAEKYIRNTILSLINQTSRCFDIVLVDDGSPDNSTDIAIDLIKASDITYSIIKQKNLGQGIARNTGLSAASGEWVLFLDSDDTLQPFAIEMLSAIANKYQDVDAIFSDFKNVNEKNIFSLSEKNDYIEVLSHDEIIKSFLRRDRNLLVPGTLYRIDFLRQNNIEHREIRWSEDQCFQWEVLNRLKKCVYLRCALYNYLSRSGSIMDATKVDVMISAYNTYVNLSLSMTDAFLKKFLLPRWVLGCLHVVAKRKNLIEWNYLWNNMNGSDCMKNLISFPDLKVKILAMLGLINKKLLYKVLK